MFISIRCCGDACGLGDAVGTCMPGMFICWGEAFGIGGVLVAGTFIPGIFPICRFVADDLLRAVRFFRRVCLCIPAMFMPGVFAMVCLFGGFFFLVEGLFFCDAGIFMPGISCDLTHGADAAT